MSELGPDFEPRPLTPEELKARKRRNLWLGLALFAFVIAVLAITMIRLGQGTGMPDGGF